jgi:hypothetical protein
MAAGRRGNHPSNVQSSPRGLKLSLNTLMQLSGFKFINGAIFRSSYARDAKNGNGLAQYRRRRGYAFYGGKGGVYKKTMRSRFEKSALRGSAAAPDRAPPHIINAKTAAGESADNTTASDNNHEDRFMKHPFFA